MTQSGIHQKIFTKMDNKKFMTNKVFHGDLIFTIIFL